MIQFSVPRLSAIAYLSLFYAVSVCLSGSTVAAQETSGLHETPEHLVDDLHSAFGVHPMRAVHAKGILLKGSFKADPAARELSKASLFDGKLRPLTIRFSDFTGLPDISDASQDANPRGFAFKVHMTDEKDYDVVAHSFNGFPVATSDQFGEFMRAVGESQNSTSHPNAVERFLDGHPLAKTFVNTQKPPPVSFATTAYFGVNAFRYTNQLGRSVYVRYRLIPLAGEHYLDAQAAAKKGQNYLRSEVAERIGAGPIRFDWFAQIAEPGDVIDNPSLPWPESRRLVKLGTVTIDGVEPDPRTVDQDLIFLPGRVPEGIEVADPMLTVRNDAYAVSLDGRQP